MTKFMTIKQAAEFLEVTPRTVQRWIAARLFPVTRYSARTVRIDADDLKRFKARKTK